MANITIAIDDDLLKDSREYAQRHNLSLNAFIRDLLVGTVNNPQRGWTEEMLAHIEKAAGNSNGRKWKRDDIYDV